MFRMTALQIQIQKRILAGLESFFSKALLQRGVQKIRTEEDAPVLPLYFLIK
jgi:hypothetical protein